VRSRGIRGGGGVRRGEVSEVGKRRECVVREVKILAVEAGEGVKSGRRIHQHDLMIFAVHPRVGLIFEVLILRERLRV
jgi:hypothetical protein